jgi:hypothetical protein
VSLTGRDRRRNGPSRDLALRATGLAEIEAAGTMIECYPVCGKKMRQVAKLLLGTLTLTGCAHKSVIQEKTDEFVGHPLGAITAKLGAPAEEGEVGGAKMYIWTGADSAQGRCTIRATMMGDVIGSFDWEGTESQCANYALMLKGSDCRRGMMDARLWVPSCP